MGCGSGAEKLPGAAAYADSVHLVLVFQATYACFLVIRVKKPLLCGLLMSYL